MSQPGNCVKQLFLGPLPARQGCGRDVGAPEKELYPSRSVSPPSAARSSESPVVTVSGVNSERSGSDRLPGAPLRARARCSASARSWSVTAATGPSGCSCATAARLQGSYHTVSAEGYPAALSYLAANI